MCRVEACVHILTPITTACYVDQLYGVRTVWMDPARDCSGGENNCVRIISGLYGNNHNLLGGWLTYIEGDQNLPRSQSSVFITNNWPGRRSQVTMKPPYDDKQEGNRGQSQARLSRGNGRGLDRLWKLGGTFTKPCPFFIVRGPVNGRGPYRRVYRECSVDRYRPGCPWGNIINFGPAE